jgi:hypothetical protein
MDPEQFQHLINMLAGVQQCLVFIGSCLLWHVAVTFIAAPTKSDHSEIVSAINKFTSTLKSR